MAIDGVKVYVSVIYGSMKIKQLGLLYIVFSHCYIQLFLLFFTDTQIYLDFNLAHIECTKIIMKAKKKNSDSFTDCFWFLGCFMCGFLVFFVVFKLFFRLSQLKCNHELRTV